MKYLWAGAAGALTVVVIATAVLLIGDYQVTKKGTVVPSVVGAPLNAAEAEIESHGLSVEVDKSSYNPFLEHPSVTSQLPAAGTLVDQGSAVTLGVGN